MKFKNKETGEIRDCTPNMLNAALVSAQNRKRLFWVGNLINNSYEAVCVPPPEDRGIMLKDIIEGEFNGLWSDYNNSTVFDKARTLGAGCGITRSSTCQEVIKDPVRIGKIGKGGQGDRVYSIEGKSTTLSANGGGRGAKTGLYFISDKHLNAMKKCNKNFKTRDLEGKSTTLTATYYKTPCDGNYIEVTAPNGKKVELDVEGDDPYVFKEVRTEEGKRKRSEIRKTEGVDTTPRGIEDKKYVPDTCGKANCITTSPGVEGLMAVKDYVRKLFPSECEKLQSLVVGYTESGINDKGLEVKISDTQRYKTLGNAFNADIVTHIFGCIKEKV